MRVLGVDPGLRATGYGLVEGEGGRFRHLGHGAIEVVPGPTFAQRLCRIYQGLAEVIEQHSPDVVAVEQIFYAKNVKVALQLGHARAAALLPGAIKGLEVVEYSPTEVKQGVVGYGRAGKSQVSQMVGVILGLGAPPEPDHAADALAVALCHLQSNKLLKVLARK